MVEKTIIPGNVHKKIPSDILHRIELIVDVNKAIITNNVFAMRELLPHVEKYEYLTNQIKAALGEMVIPIPPKKRRAFVPKNVIYFPDPGQVCPKCETPGHKQKFTERKNYSTQSYRCVNPLCRHCWTAIVGTGEILSRYYRCDAKYPCPTCKAAGRKKNGFITCRNGHKWYG